MSRKEDECNPLSSGSWDRNILHRDVRAPDDYVIKYVGHRAEVLGLKWSYDDRELASGGDDDMLFIWSANSTRPILRYSEHSAAGVYTRRHFSST